jgi:hydroxymethylpyrimidine pyrophosphatase-like HAD family hydrolase
VAAAGAAARAGHRLRPASGRQLATLQQTFAAVDGELDYIAENGAYVVRGDVEVSSDAVDPAVAASVVAPACSSRRTLRAGLVLCGKRSAYVEDTDPRFLAEVEKYARRGRGRSSRRGRSDPQARDLRPRRRRGAHRPAFADLAQTHQVVVSGHHWVDIMNATVNKGVALRRCRRRSV